MIQIKEVGNYLLIGSDLASKGKWEFQQQPDGKWDITLNNILIHDGVAYTDFEDEFAQPFATNDDFRDFVCGISGIIGAGTSTGGSVPVPLDVTETNPLSLTAVETSLTSIITELQGVDANTDNLETQLTSVISTLQNIENTTGISNTNEGLIRGEIQNTNTALGTLEDDVEALYDKTTSSTVTAVSVGVTATNLLSSSATRKKAIIENNGNKTIYVKFGATASTTDFSFKLAKDEIWEELNYQGIITAVTSSGSSSINVTSI